MLKNQSPELIGQLKPLLFAVGVRVATAMNFVWIPGKSEDRFLVALQFSNRKLWTIGDIPQNFVRRGVMQHHGPALHRLRKLILRPTIADPSRQQPSRAYSSASDARARKFKLGHYQTPPRGALLSTVTDARRGLTSGSRTRRMGSLRLLPLSKKRAVSFNLTSIGFARRSQLYKLKINL